MNTLKFLEGAYCLPWGNALSFSAQAYIRSTYIELRRGPDSLWHRGTYLTL